MYAKTLVPIICEVYCTQIFPLKIWKCDFLVCLVLLERKLPLGMMFTDNSYKNPKTQTILKMILDDC